jgi:GPI mannosyltransferase 1 subunit M
MTQKYLSFPVLVLGGLAFRLVLVAYGEYHDKHSPLKYTDIDYRVFSDAATFILHPTERNHAQGHLGGNLDLGE